MILSILNRILRNRVRKISFPKLHPKKFNYLWEISKNTLINISIFELFPIIRCLFFKFGPSSLLGIPIIFLIVKNSGILEQKDSETHLKMFKALNVDNNNVEKFFTFSLIFSLIIKVISILIWLLWLPLKISIILFILDYLNYDITYLYYKLNNLSLGTLNWYYQTLIDLLESFRFKYDLYIINNK